jgi:hypothetical protein
MIKFRYWLLRAAWWIQKKLDKRRSLTNIQEKKLASYYNSAISVFNSIEIDIYKKPTESQRLYFMVLIWLDNEEFICPAGARTATLIGFLDSLGSGWQMPPTSEAVSADFAKDVDNYMALEVFRNNLGLGDIRKEIVDAINSHGTNRK